MLNKINIAVLVGGGGTNLQALLDAADRGEIPSGNISLVISGKEGAYALERAKKHNVPTATADRKWYEKQEDFEEAILSSLKENNIRLIVLAGFMWILSADFIEKSGCKIINVHPALIPSFCGKGFYGLKVHEAALEYGVKVSGATVHFVNEIPDGGQIIMQKAVDVLDDDTPETLQKRIMEQAEWKLLPAATQKVCEELIKES
ncbi:MAG: phosphoribosylglycinamide formyltransferase [Clostridia bacterium]|nr:phosphoribosylglycinamide formyltransferase [Clostridia bacterium]